MALALGAHVRLLVAHTSRASRLHLFAGAVLALAGRLGIVATAYEISRGEIFHATVLGVGVSLVIFLQRAVAASARVLVERDLHRSAVRAILESDVFIMLEDIHRAVFDTIYKARTLLVDSVPVLIADAIAVVVITPILLQAFPIRVLAIAAAGLVAILATVVALRGIIRRMEQRVLDAYQGVVERMLILIEGRLEIVANAREKRCTEDIDSALARYTKLGRQNAFSGALLGRAPLLAGGIAVGLLAFLDSASRDALSVAVLGQAVLLAACAPPIIGAALATQELVRSSVLVGPLTTLLRATPRSDLERRGADRPKLPSAASARDLSFAYAEGEKVILDKVSFDWSAEKPLILVGPNGSGKSTLLRQLLALREPSKGLVEVGGLDLQRADVIAMRAGVAYLPQRPYLGEPSTSVRDALGLAFTGADDAAMLRALERSRFILTLRKRTSDPLALSVGELSAGQRQRVALARVLLVDASMLLLDEPDANLDREGVALVVEIIRELVEAGKMVAIAAHTPELATIPGLRVTLGTVEDVP